MDIIEAEINKADVILRESHNCLITEGSAALVGHAALPRKLADIYAEEANKPNKIKQNVSQTGRLISKLVERENLSSLIVNLHRGNEGFSIALKLPGGVETETIRIPYEDDEFLSYIDQEQLPPMLLDLLDESGVSDIFQSGCLVAEIRDYRRYTHDPVTLTNTSQHAPYSDTRHVLLKPTMQSLAADIATMTRDKDWTNSDRLRLEAEIVRATAPPLCLSPSLSAGLIHRRLHTHATNTHSLRHAAKRSSQPSQNRIKKFEEGPAPKRLRLMNFLNERKDRRPIAKSIPKPLVPLATEHTMEPFPPEFFANLSQPLPEFMKSVVEEVSKLAKVQERPPDTSDNSLHFVEEYTLETEKGQGRIYLTKLTIYQRHTDEVYCGELYVDRDYQEGKTNGSTCTFKHSSLQSVHRYIAQFREIFSEEGRKTVKITHHVAGLPPLVNFLQGTREKAAEQQQQRQAAQNKQLQQQQKQQIFQSTTVQQQQTATSGQQQVAAVPTCAVQQGLPVTIGQIHPQNLLIVTNNNDRQQQQLGGVVVSCVSGGVVSSSTTGVVVCRAPTPQHHVTTTRIHHSASQLPSVSLGVSVSQHQPVLLQGRSVHLGNLLSARVSSPGLHHTHQYRMSIAGGTSTASGTSVKSESLVGINKSPMLTTSSGHGAVPALQALLAGTPSAENPAPHSRGATLIERLQSGMTSKADMGSVKVDISASALPVITTIHSTSTTGSIVCSSPHLLGGASGHSSSGGVAGSIVCSSPAAVLRGDAGGPSPNINIANITNLPGLNVGLQNLTSGLTGLQNVQVSIPGLPVPISLSLTPAPANGRRSNTGQQQQHQPAGVGGSGGTPGSTPATAPPTSGGGQTVVLATTTSQGHLLHLPIVHGSQLAAHLSKPSQQSQQPSAINVLQTLNSSSNNSSVGGVSNTAAVVVSSGGVVTTIGGAGSSGGAELLVSSASLLPRPQVAPRTSKQQLQLALQKQGQGKLNQQLQQKLMLLAAKKSQQLQLQQQQLVQHKLQPSQQQQQPPQ